VSGVEDLLGESAQPVYVIGCKPPDCQARHSFQTLS
jgi:hypothetical protein